MMGIRRKGCLFIVSGPSGAGKTSICTPALARLQGIALSVSFTTRGPRGTEIDGRDYHFVTAERFDEMVEAGAFAEWAEVHGNRYGTARSTLDDALDAGRDVLLDIDVQGAEQILRAYPEAVAIFLLPPSRARLEERLRGRGTDDEATVRRRLVNAFREIQGVRRYRYMIVNHELDAAVDEFLAIVMAERCRVALIEPLELERVVEGFAVEASEASTTNGEGEPRK